MHVHASRPPRARGQPSGRPACPSNGAAIRSHTPVAAAAAPPPAHLLDAFRHHLLHAHQLLCLQRRVEAEHLEGVQLGVIQDAVLQAARDRRRRRWAASLGRSTRKASAGHTEDAVLRNALARRWQAGRQRSVLLVFNQQISTTLHDLYALLRHPSVLTQRAASPRPCRTA